MAVWLAQIEHSHGYDISVHRTRESALILVARYCDEYWYELAEQGKPVEKPADKQEKIDRYFELRDDECYGLESVEVHNLMHVISEAPEIGDV